MVINSANEKLAEPRILKTLVKPYLNTATY